METIGDAYMVVGGLPKPCDNHAEKVAHMACSMMEASRKVLSPVDRTPLKVVASIQNWFRRVLSIWKSSLEFVIQTLISGSVAGGFNREWCERAPKVGREVKNRQ